LRGTILQPLYLPWMGYFEMIAAAEVFVIFDHVPFARKSWQSRNRIKGPNGEVMLNVPVEREHRGNPISGIRVNYSQGDPLENHWKTVRLSYGKAEYFAEHSGFLEEIYQRKPELLSNLNQQIISSVCKILGIGTPMVRSSTLSLSDENLRGTERVISVCKAAGITQLYDGAAAKGFLDTELMKREGVSIRFQEYKHPEYRQLWGPFLPYMSVIDVLFNEGPDAMRIIKSGASGEVAT
jgi:hypothetical protein